MRRLRHIRAVLAISAKLGWGRLAWWLWHKFLLRTGLYRRSTPIRRWQPYSGEVASVLSLHLPEPKEISVEVIAAADRILSGHLPMFGWTEVAIDHVWPPRTDLPHWSQVNLSSPDPKLRWEPARFGWIFVLLRAWRATGDDRYRAGIERTLERWRASALPNSGVDWACGQECGLRILALCHWISVLRAERQGVPEIAGSTIAALAERIAPAMHYAVAQRNNHALSEALGLYIAGLTLPQHPQAAGWVRRGFQTFVNEALDQFAEDGTYLLNSFNYQREAMRLLTLFVLACRNVGKEIPKLLLSRLEAAASFVDSVQLGESGRVPQYGADDGTNLFSWSSCAYSDFRPVIQSSFYAATGRRLYPAGPWDEELAWQFGPSATGAEVKELPRHDAARGGYFTLHGDRSDGLVRCHTHTTRPGHADMLHFDLWFDGKNVLGDGGTFSYADPGGVGERLKGTAAHNTVRLGGQDQMRSIGKFLWGDWTESKLLSRSDERTHWSGEHYGYVRSGSGWVHRRSICVQGDAWEIEDHFRSVGDAPQESVELFWHLSQGEWHLVDQGAQSSELKLDVRVTANRPIQIRFHQPDPTDPVTFRSPHYGELLCAPVIVAHGQTAADLKLKTIVRPI